MEPVPSIKIHKSTPFSRVSSSCKAECMSDALTAESAIPLPCRKKEKEKFTLFSDHNGSLLRRQPGAMTIGHNPKGKEKS